MNSIDKRDLLVIKQQLGRFPKNIMEVVCYCPWDYPLVLKTYPYHEETDVFPTLFWLSCPFLVKKVARLEDSGLVKQYTQELKNNPEFKQKVNKAHREYARKRFSLLEEQEIEEIKCISNDLLKMIKDSGVGGIRDKEGIKCLHTHLADYFVRKLNPVGKRINQLLPSLKECPRKCDQFKHKKEDK